MIEWIEAASGEKVIRCDGRLMASRYFPAVEAADWLARRRAFVASVKSVFILGAGSGFNILEVGKASDAQLIVIEQHEELREAVKPMLKDLGDRVTWVNAKSARDLRNDESVRKALSNSFVVLEHPASVSLDPTSYREMAALLRARDWGPLNWQWKLKGFAELDTQPKVKPIENPLTIHDLENCELVQSSGERERLLLLALRELVK